MPRFHKNGILVLAGILALCACDPVEIEIDPDPTIDECLFHVSDSNIVVSVSESRDSIHFLLENGKTISRPNSCIMNVSVDSANWKVEIEYLDSTRQSAPYLGNVFRIEEDSIVLDPYGRAPLTARVSFTLPVAGRIRMTVRGRNEGSPEVSHTFDSFETRHSIPVYGLYPEFENRVTLAVLDVAGKERVSRTIAITTEPAGTIESGHMNVQINQYIGSQRYKLFLVQNAIYDTEGYIRWYSRYRGNKYFALDERLIAIQLLNDKGDPATLVEDIRIMNLMGEEVQLVDVPNRNHHEIIEKRPGGNLLVASNAQPYESVADDTEDMIVEIDRLSGLVVKSWDLREIFDPARPRLWTEMPNDWCHLNSIEYDSTDNTLLISSKLQYFISKIDYETGQIKWIFGNHENWDEPWQEYLLSPANFDSLVHQDRDWVYAQHMPRLTGNGTVIVYDNGRDRPGGDFTRILEFRVDTAKMTVEKVWTHDFSFSTKVMGSVQIVENDNVLIGHGEKGIIHEVTREGEVVFEAKMGYFYRAYPIQFY